MYAIHLSRSFRTAAQANKPPSPICDLPVSFAASLATSECNVHHSVLFRSCQGYRIYPLSTSERPPPSMFSFLLPLLFVFSLSTSIAFNGSYPVAHSRYLLHTYHWRRTHHKALGYRCRKKILSHLCALLVANHNGNTAAQLVECR